MKRFLLLCFSLFSASSFAQAPHIQWQKCYGGTGLDVATCIIQTADSGYIMEGYATSNNFDVTGAHGGYDIWVVKTDATGAIVWQHPYGGSLDDEGNFIQQTADGGYIVAGISLSTDGDATANYGQYDWWVLKLTSTGAITWQHNFGGSDVDVLHCIRQTADGGYILIGRTGSSDHDVTFNHGGDDIWVMKLTAGGTISWQKTYGGSGDEDAGGIWPTADGGYYIAGNTRSNDGDVSGNHGDDDIWVAKIDSVGNLIWQKCLGGSLDDDVIEDPASAAMQGTLDSGLILAGWTNSNDGDVTGNYGSFDYWVVKLSDTGHIEWQHNFGGTRAEFPSSIQQTRDSGYMIMGTSASNDHDVTGNRGTNDYWTIKLNRTGALQWEKCTGGTGGVVGEIGNYGRQTFDGGYILAGGTNSNDSDVSGNHGGYDYWVVKLFNETTLAAPDIQDPAISVIPNPATDRIFINGGPGPTRTVVCNLAGQQLIEADHTREISLSTLAPGMYFISIFSDGLLLKREKIVKQ